MNAMDKAAYPAGDNPPRHLATYSEGCDRCDQPEPDSVWVNDAGTTLCDSCFAPANNGRT